MYLSGHPMSPYAAVYNAGIAARFDEIARSAAGESDQYKDEQYVDVLAVVESVKKKVTRSGSAMAFVTLEDMYGSMEALVFPKVLENTATFLRQAALFGRTDASALRKKKTRSSSANMPRHRFRRKK